MALPLRTKDAYLTASSGRNARQRATTVADPTTGAFTMEALVWIGFDPAKNLGPAATAAMGALAHVKS